MQNIANSADYSDVAVADVHTVCEKMLSQKHYYELAANNINHPNDFIHRVYAMCVLSVMFDYSQAE